MKKRLRKPKPLHPLLASATGPALIKYLASCNTTIRSQSLRQLQSWLQSQPQHLSDSDINKLWKGLFYCMWHSDKTPNQVALIDRLTSLFLSLDPPLALDFFRGFLITLRREWPGIDRLRLDKFYLLIRRFMKALFELMRLRKWDSDVLGEYFGVLERDGLMAEDKLQGNGVNYHIASVFLEELKGVGFPATKEVVNAIFWPFLAVLLRSKDKILLGKVKSLVFGELVNAGKQLLEKKKIEENCDEKNGDVLLGVVALKMCLSGMFYEVGSSEECVQGNRKVVLGLHEEFLKLEKELESSKIEIALPEYSHVDDEEVPQLVPVDDNTSNGYVELSLTEGPEDEGQADDRIRKKKSKKAKKEMDGDDKKSKKKSKKVRKEMDGNDKKSEKKTNKKKDDNVVPATDSSVNENGTILTDNGMENSLSPDDLETLGNVVALNEDVISNLQKQFEKVAAEGSSFNEEDSDFPGTPLLVKHNTRSHKKKRAKHADSNGAGDDEVDISAKSVDKNTKKVTFSMKNNLVWKPTTPLPPESLRLPPTVVPRGSALKKGVPPGPVVETPLKKKRVNQRKKNLKRMRSATPMVKRRNKVLTGSA